MGKNNYLAYSILVLTSFTIILGFSSMVFSQNIPDYKDKYVNDFANVLTVSQAEELKNLFYNVDQDTTAEIVFVSFDSINGEDISQYATKIGQDWKVGKADKDNGLVILYVKETGKIWVSTGYGLEGIFPDSKVGRLLDQSYVPLRDLGNVSQGILEFGYAVAQVIYNNKAEVLSGQAGPTGNSGTDWYSIFIYFLIAYFFLSVILRVFKVGRREGSSLWFIPLFLPSGGNSSFGGGSGFGGGGFGGGGAGR